MRTLFGFLNSSFISRLRRRDRRPAFAALDLHLFDHDIRL